MVINTIPLEEASLLLKSKITLLMEVSDDHNVMITLAKKKKIILFYRFMRMYTLNIIGKYWSRVKRKKLLKELFQIDLLQSIYLSFLKLTKTDKKFTLVA